MSQPALTADLSFGSQDAPAPLPRVAVLMVSALLGLLVAWAAWAKLDIVATAPGRLVPQSFSKVVQPPDAGVVAQVLVHDGDRVEAGQLLLRLDARVARAEAATLAQETELRQLTLARLDAELSGRPLRLPATATPALAAQVQAQYEARRLQQQDRLAQEQAALQRTSAELAAARQQLQRLQAVLPILQIAAERHERLAQDGFVSALVAADKRREALDKAGELRAQEDSVRALEAAREQQARRLEGVVSSERADRQAERLEQLARLETLAQEARKSQVHTGQLDIRAPAAGIVKDLAIAAPGAVVQAGALLMNIVPQDEPLEAEILLRNEDVGFVHAGQDVRLKLATYPFQRHGLLGGVVRLVAADASPPPEAQRGAEPGYRAFVRLTSQQLRTPEGERLALVAGMQLSAEVQLGQRSVLEYLFSPLRKLGAEAAREP